MQRLAPKYLAQERKIPNLRASRVDYYTQHDVAEWVDQLGSIGAGGPESVFVNLAAVAGPVPEKKDAMYAINYKACVAAAAACQALSFGHFIQSSTQATVTERAGQVSYSKAKGMADFALSRMDMPVTIAVLGLLYCKLEKNLGQDNGPDKINLTDLALLPLTPILGSGTAKLQPQEVSDAARRIAFLAMTDPADRPRTETSNLKLSQMQSKFPGLRVYNAVGPEVMTILTLLSKFAYFQKRSGFYPVFVGYRNFELILNIKSIGNLNRQFVSLLRSEQDGETMATGDPDVWDKLLVDAPLETLDGAMGHDVMKRRFPYWKTARWVMENPRIIPYGLLLSAEIVESFLMGRTGEGTAWK